MRTIAAPALAFIAVAAHSLGDAWALDRPADQVLIETRFVEIDQRFVQDLGIDWNTGAVDPGSGITIGTVGGGRLPTSAGAPPAGQPGAGTGSLENLGSILRALENADRAKVIAAPKVLTADNQQASIFVGGDLPIRVPDQGTTVEYKNFGITLQVRPRIQDSGAVRLEIVPEVSGLDTTVVPPQLQIRRARTSVLIDQGQTTVIGGLIDRNLIEESSKVPGLDNIPYLRWLFRSGQTTTQQRELLIFIGPPRAGAPAQVSAVPPAGRPSGPDHGLYSTASGAVVSFFAGYDGQDHRDFEALRFEENQQIIEIPVVSFDTTTDATELGIDLGYFFDQPLFGDKTWIKVSGTYQSAETDGHKDFIDSNDTTLGVADPFGGGVSFAPPNGDINDLDFDFDFEKVHISIAGYESIGFEELALTLSGGLVVDRTYSDSTLTFQTNGNPGNGFFTDIERRDELTAWSVGPQVGALVSREVFDHAKLYAGGHVMAGMATVDGWTGLMLEGLGAQMRKLDVSRDLFVYEAGADVGLQLDFDPIFVDIKGSLGVGNGSFYVDYQDNEDSEIEQSTELEQTIGVTFSYTF
jgi:hypothetical protein